MDQKLAARVLPKSTLERERQASFNFERERWCNQFELLLATVSCHHDPLDTVKHQSSNSNTIKLSQSKQGNQVRVHRIKD